jgi:hypothetical protein
VKLRILVIHSVLGATLIARKAVLVTMRTPRMIQTVSIENVAVHSCAFIQFYH